MSKRNGFRTKKCNSIVGKRNGCSDPILKIKNKKYRVTIKENIRRFRNHNYSVISSE